MADLEVLGVDNIMLAVGDLEQARGFYESTLGLPVKFAVPQAGVVGYRLGGEEPALRAKGARILGEPMEILTGWAVELADPWGNVLGLTDYRKDPARGRSSSG